MAKPKNKYMIINNIIEKNRIAFGYTQKEVAALIGINVNTYRDYESSRTFPPKVEVREKIMEVLNIPKTVAVWKRVEP